MKKVFYLLLTLLLSQHALAINTIDWIGGVSDDWTNPANWSAGRLPISSELVNINASSQRNLVIYSGSSITVTAIVLENTDKSLIINSGATLTGIAGHNFMIYLDEGTSLTNNGTINYTTIGRSTEVPFSGGGTFASNFINNGTINVNSNDAVFGISVNASMNITNNGIITITQAKYGFYGEANTTNNGTIEFTSSITNPYVFNGSAATVINNACGKFIAHAGFFESKTTTNAGYMQISGLLKAATGQSITNTGVLIYGSINTSQLNNTGNSAVIVNNRPYNSSVFTFAGTFNGTIHGIYTDLAATNLAGTLNASYVFVAAPSLPSGDLTLYAKITPSGGGCAYIVPFTYNKDNEMEIRGNNVIILDGLISTSSSNNTDFGSQSFFSGTRVKTFTIYNKGNLTLNLTGTPKVTISGTNSSDFTVTAQPASPIAAENDSTTFEITFDPSGGGARVADVNIANDDANENPYNFRIQGTGTCDAPTGVSVNNTVICNGESISLTAACTIGTVTWYNQSAGGTAIGTGSPLSYTPTSSRSYYVTCNSGVCESSRVSTSLVNILSSGNIPTAVSVDRTTICLGGSVTLSATCALGTITWYNQATGGTAIGTGTSLSQSPTVNTTYYAACNNTNCESNRVATSQIVIGSNPTATISYPATLYHITAGAANVTLIGTSGGTFTSAPTGLSINSSSGQITPGSSTIGTYTVTYTMAANGGCSSATATTSVTITSVPIVVLTSNNNPASIGANVQLMATITPNTATGTVTFKDGTTTIGTATLNSGIASVNTSLLVLGMHTITAEYGGDGSNDASTSTAFSQVVNALTEPDLNFITQSAGSSGTDEVIGKGVVVDATGNVYKTGYFKGTVTFGSTTLTSVGSYDIFIVKYNTSGIEQWAKRAGGTGDDRGNGIAISGTDIYVTGQFQVTANFNTPSASGSNELVSAGSTDIFVAKYNGSGTLEWIKRAGGTSIDIGNGITILGTDVYITGSFVSIANFNTPSATGTNQLTSAGGSDIFLARYNSSGDVQWLKRGGGTSLDASLGISASGVNVYITGYIASGTANFNTPSATGSNEITSAGSNDIFIAVFNTSGNLQWVKRAGGTSFDRGNGIIASGDYVYITGYFFGTINFNNPSSSGSNEITGADGESFIAKYDDSGTFLWAKRMGGTGDDEGFGLAVIGTNVYLTGRFTETANFNTPSASGTNEIESVGGNDIFMAKYDETGNFQWAKRAGAGDPNDDVGYALAGSNTSLYATGIFRSNANFNNPSATGSNGLVSVGLTESFVASYNISSVISTTTTLTSDNNPASIGANVQFTATVSPSTATGIVTFKEGSVTLGTATLSGGVATFTTNILTGGTHEITAEYGGDSDFSGSTSSVLSQVINCVAPSVSITGSTNLTCATTSVTRTANGGGTYLWSNSLGTNAIANITSPGTYTVTVTGTNGCSATATTSITQDGSLPTVSITGTTNLTCATTSVTRTASGGGTYLWSNSLGTNAIANITSPGTYIVTVTGTNGCTATATTSVTQNIVTPTASITGSANLTCATTTVTRTASGGGTYQWSNGLGTNAIANITSQGTYTVTVTGTNGCTATATTSVTQDGSLPTVSITGSTNLTCTIISVTRTASGGGTYLWSNSLGTNAIANITSPGTYTVTVTGTNGCSATATTSVTQDGSLPSASITGSTNLTCTTTSVTRTASGGGTYAWSGGLGTNAIANITSPGTYIVTVTGTNGCTATATTSVTQDGSLPSASITGSTNLTCTTTSVTRTASGGGTYLWSNSLGTNAAATITSPGTYTVTVTGSNGCTATATTSVTRDIVTPTASITGSTNLSCTTTSVTRTASGGGTYQWSNGLGTNAIATITSPGTYIVTVTGANGCTATATTSVTQDGSLPTVSITGSTNLTCATTSVTSTATGGGTYQWSNGLGTNAIANITSPGTYTVTVTGTNGCTATATTSVTQDGSLPSASITGSTNLTCTTTSVTRTASGGVTYLWSNSLGTNAIANITSPGTYTVTVTGTNGCTATATTSVTQDGSLPTVSITGSTNLTCTIISVTRTASGGGTYLWSNSLGTNAIANITSPGTYTVTVTGTNGCTATATTSVTQDGSLPTVSITGSTNLTCATTSVTRTASGGGTYQWSNGLGTNAIANITSPGTYTVTVTGTNGCTATATTSVTQDIVTPTANITGSTNLTCTTTSVTRTASGGGTYQWSNGLGTNAIADITSPGTYIVTVTGSNGCTATAITSVTQDGSLPTVSITGSTNLTCATTSVTRTVSGGDTYLWSNGLGTNAIANITSPGTYTVTVTGTNGCTATATTSVTQDGSLPTVSITGSTNLTCATTSVTRTASGGGTYQWSNGLGTNAIANITSPGTYTVTVTGSNGCTATATTSVTQDGSLPTISITGSTNLTCTTTSVTRTASGGGTYLWSNSLGTNAIANITSPGTYTVTVTGTNGCTATATTTVIQDGSLPTASITGSTNLTCTTTSVTRTASGGGTYAWSGGLGTNPIANITSPGTYTVTVTETNGCTATATTNVTQDGSLPTVSITGSTNLTCTTTSVTRTASGGGTYQWSNGLGTNVAATITSPGTYTVTVTGTNGCTATATTSVTQDGSLPTVSITGSTNLTCTTTSVTRTASGGGTYVWSGGLGTNAIANITSPGTYTVTVTGTNGCTATATTSVTQDGSLPTISIIGTTNLTCTTTSVTRTASGGGTYQWSNGLGTNAIANITSPGTYTVTVTGTNGCTATATASVTQNGSLPTVSITGSTNLTCATTSVTRTASGGGTYAWSGGLGTNAIANITSPGTYTVTATGTNGCTATATTSVTQDGSLPTVSITGSTNLTCTTTSVTRTASGGGTYQWSNGLGTNVAATITSPGTYTVTVTGTNGCTATATTSVTQDGSLPTVSITGSTNLTCTTTSVTRTASGGGTYLWSNGLGTNAAATITSPGTYTVTVTGSNGCTATATTSVTQDIVTPTANITGSTNLTCATTSVTRTASGGGTYQWSGGLGTNAIANITSPGTYTVTVTGTNGCTVTATTNVAQDIVTPTTSITGSTNLTCTTTSVTRTASGGGTYVWSGELGTNAIANITSPGTYTVTVTGTNGCTATATTNVTQDIVTPTASITGSTNLTCTTASVTRTASGGRTYVWSNSLGTNAIADITSPGTYTVTVTGTNGCTATATTSVTQNLVLAANASNTGPYNFGQTIQLNSSGGDSYSWSGPGSFVSSIENPTIPNALVGSGGTYTVTVRSGVCTATATTNVIVNGVDPCAKIVDLQYVKAGDPYQPMFSLKDGMVIQQIPEHISIIANPICPTIPIGSVDMTIVGPEINWTILQNVQPYAVFDNLGVNVYGRNFIPGTYTITLTGYAEDNRIGGTVYGPVVTTFTVVGTMSAINAPTIPNNRLCAGGKVDVTFTTTGSFSPTNTFNIQLSDTTGGFTNPILIGMSTVAGTITCQLPQNLSASGHYLIRVASSNQAVASNPTMQFLSVTPASKSLAANINAGTITEKASLQINADNKITSSANVTYQAGQSIVLSPGFEAVTGSIFKAQIQACNN